MIIVRACARDKFIRWKKVRVTDEGRQFLTPPPGRKLDDRGVVVGFGHRSDVVRVLRAGHRQPESFPADFWEHP